MLNLFHVSGLDFQPGCVLGPFDETTFYRRRRSDPTIADLESAFEELRPAGLPSRRRAVFSFASHSECINFWSGERDRGRAREYYTGNPNVYEVIIEAPFSAPMILVGHALRRLKDGLAIEPIIDEYWSPTYEWKHWEFLGDRMTIIRKVSKWNNRSCGVRIYKAMKDQRLAEKLWPLKEIGG